ncbi:hypothetical protein FB471_5416 [Amycolatopsis cihanbeyliensis]|uniref:Lipoprotein n=1 Tax=Amycolatopsis cihanbeyliensis TaxID=1128664 RepID=A0A542DR57_AMYCI|nr:hypothetical protein FB471_5416 [Amycolatopsis cihanbeyliensis]
MRKLLTIVAGAALALGCGLLGRRLAQRSSTQVHRVEP